MTSSNGTTTGSSTNTSPENNIPPPSENIPIDMEELMAAIGELYLQVRVQRRIIQQIQSAPRRDSEAI